LTDEDKAFMLMSMTTTLTSKGQILLPPKVRRDKKLRAGDELEILSDAEDADVILLRRVRKQPNQGLVALLRSCPVKGFRLPRRSRELPRVIQL